MPPSQPIRQKYLALRPLLNERQRRLWAAAEARAIGHGGIARVAEEIGMSPHTIRAGLRELDRLAQGDPATLLPGRVRKHGAGRKSRLEESPGLLRDLESLIEPVSSGESRSPLRWTCEGTARLAALLEEHGHTASPRLVARLLRQLGYSLQSARRSADSEHGPERSKQFEFVSTQVDTFHRRGHPVLAVSSARKVHLADEAEVRGLLDPETLTECASEIVADEEASPGWVTTVLEQDTASFVVGVVRHWWWNAGRLAFPEARQLLLVSDFAGSRGKTGRFWKLTVQGLADETGLTITLCYFPPGTTRWARVEQSLTADCEMDLGDTRVCQQANLQLIGSANSAAGMVLRPDFDRARRQSGLRVLESQVSSLLLEPASYRGDWNYTIRSHPEDSPPTPSQSAS